MSSQAIQSVNSQETYGTCEETVLANNRGRKLATINFRGGGSHDSSQVLGLDEIGTFSTDGTGSTPRNSYDGSQSTGIALNSYSNGIPFKASSKSNSQSSLGLNSVPSDAMKRTLSKRRSAGGTKNQKDGGCTDILKFIFCLGNDTTTEDDNRSPANGRRGNGQYGSPRLSSSHGSFSRDKMLPPRSDNKKGKGSGRSMGSPLRQDKGSNRSMGSPPKPSKGRGGSMDSPPRISNRSNRSMDSPLSRSPRGSGRSMNTPPRTQSRSGSENSLQILRNASTKSMNNASKIRETSESRNARKMTKSPKGSKNSFKNKKVAPDPMDSDDAKLLSTIMKESNEKHRKSKGRSSGIPAIGAEGLDIVMELQLQEATAPSSPPPRRQNSSKYISGAPIGSFQNISTKENAAHDEVVDTYMDYRMDKKTIEKVLHRVPCNLPLYHHGSNNDMRRQDSELSTVSTGGISSKIKNVCSEPVARSFSVRGPTYAADGIKIPSDETIFALLGADSVLKAKQQDYRECDVSKSKVSFYNNLKATSTRLGMKAPFLIVVNFVVPWGNLLAYFYRPDGDKGRALNSSRKEVKSEMLWNSFLRSDTETRNKTLKFIPRVIEGPWALKKLVGTNPAIIGQKIPTSYFGSVEDGYLEICMNVTKGGKVANSICNAVASKSSIVSLDLAFLLQGTGNEDLPEQLLTVMRLHHVSLKKVHVAPISP